MIQIFLALFICLSVLFEVGICATYVLLAMGDGGVGSFGTGFVDGCDTPCRCWELSIAPLLNHGVIFPAPQR